MTHKRFLGLPNPVRARRGGCVVGEGAVRPSTCVSNRFRTHRTEQHRGVAFGASANTVCS